MQTALIFILVFCAALLFGAIAAYPVYLAISPFSDMEFHRVISRTTSISGLVFSLLYVKYYGLLSSQGLAWRATQYSKRLTFLQYMLAGALIVLALDCLLLSMEIYVFDDRVDTSVLKMLAVIAKALLTGALVGLVDALRGPPRVQPRALSRAFATAR